MLAREEIAAVVGEAHRRNLKVAIHSRGAGSTRAAAEAGVDWIVHADLATDRDLDAVPKPACRSCPPQPSSPWCVSSASNKRSAPNRCSSTFNRMQRHYDLLGELMHKARKLGIRLLVGTDTGNNSFTRHGELHAKELEIFVKRGGYSPMEAIVAATRDNALAVGLNGQVGEVARASLPTSRYGTRTPSPISPFCRTPRIFPGSSRTAGSSIFTRATRCSPSNRPRNDGRAGGRE